LEAVALLASLGAIGLVLFYGPSMPDRGARGALGARTTLWIIAAIDALAYVGLTLAARGRGLFHIPEQMEREAPHVRQMLFSMVIVMKAMLALFGTYLVWTLIGIALHRGTGMSGMSLTLFTLAVPVPLLYYTLRLRRYRK
jgi:hypothetical protein